MKSKWSELELNGEGVTKRQLLEEIVSLADSSFLASNQMTKNTIWSESTKKKWTKPQLIQIYKNLIASNSNSNSLTNNNNKESKDEVKNNEKQSIPSPSTIHSSPSPSTISNNNNSNIMIEKAAEKIMSAEGILIVVGCSHSSALFQNWKNDSEFQSAFPQFSPFKIGYGEIESREFRTEQSSLYWGFSSLFREKSNSTAPSEFHKSILSIAQIPMLKNQQTQTQETQEEKEKEKKVDLLRHGFLMTSNVDGIFEKSGIPSTKIVESNGSIWNLQCIYCEKVWSWPFDTNTQLQFDSNSLKINSESESLIPKCAKCKRESRLNVMGSTDLEFVNQRQDIQRTFLNRFLESHMQELTVLEIGVDEINEIDLKIYCDNFLNASYFDIHPSLGTRRKKTNLIRIHPTQSQVKYAGGISIAMECEEAISQISKRLNSIISNHQNQQIHPKVEPETTTTTTNTTSENAEK